MTSYGHQLFYVFFEFFLLLKFGLNRVHQTFYLKNSILLLSVFLLLDNLSRFKNQLFDVLFVVQFVRHFLLNLSFFAAFSACDKFQQQFLFELLFSRSLLDHCCIYDLQEILVLLRRQAKVAVEKLPVLVGQFLVLHQSFFLNVFNQTASELSFNVHHLFALIHTNQTFSIHGFWKFHNVNQLCWVPNFNQPSCC